MQTSYVDLGTRHFAYPLALSWADPLQVTVAVDQVVESGEVTVFPDLQVLRGTLTLALDCLSSDTRCCYQPTATT